MERKTIGSFIAALRKANGMTQKELADRLPVSDKAVSRWERDECAPRHIAYTRNCRIVRRDLRRAS